MKAQMKETSKTVELPASLTKLMELSLDTYRSLAQLGRPGQQRAIGSVRPTCRALELLRGAYAAVSKLFLDFANLYQTFTDTVQLDKPVDQPVSPEPPSPVVKVSSLTWLPYCAVSVCPRCGAIVLAVDAAEPAARKRMAGEVYRLKKICTRSFLRSRLRSNVVASLRAIDPAKLAPDHLEFLRRLRSTLGDLVVSIYDWFKPMQDVLDAVEQLDRDPSGLPSFVIGEDGPIDVQRREPCEHLVEVGFVWSKPVTRRYSSSCLNMYTTSSTRGPLGWRRPAESGAVDSAENKAEKRPSLKHRLVQHRVKYPSRSEWELQAFDLKGKYEEQRPHGFGTFGTASFVRSAEEHHH